MDKGEGRGEDTWGDVRGSQAELTFPPEEELQLPARAGPRAGRAGPTASPPPFLPPLSFPYPPFNHQTNCCAVMNLQAEPMSNTGMFRESCQMNFSALSEGKLQRLSLR